MEQELIALAVQYGEIITRNTATYVRDRLKTAKANKNKDEQLLEYEAIINQLIEDKMELQRVTQSYKELYERVTISDDDIEYLQKSMHQFLNILVQFSPSQQENKEKFDLLIGLLNKDVLKTLQLLGFNYKEAIGIPFTELCASKINSLGSKIPVGGKRR